MTIQEYYTSTGVDFQNTLRRLGSEERLRKYLSKILEDNNFEMLLNALNAGNYKDAFLAVHSLKGICLNLDLLPLLRSSSALADNLRDGQSSSDTDRLFKQVETDYQNTMSDLKKIL
ncbi:Hpt domain-containing protein [Ruminococcus sp. OA3]|uniref:Hpt domain-containing protein n=1 Tax=Ruminococcus sp. OA3 TaxID=2914164 RepID=UPI001F0683D5|nr:Hpt domain-containing protein [Ruminococcus sp. OA3]MCH1984415.1 Hpt domain-containing protein [Ruminococcus sp. OA3]